MLLLECLDAVDHSQGLKLQLFATDIAPDAIEFARAGRYPVAIAADVAPERLARFFTPDDGHYQIRKKVRDAVVFALHDVNKDALFTKLDLLCCRNLLIYLSAELQKNLLPMVSLRPAPGRHPIFGPQRKPDRLPGPVSAPERQVENLVAPRNRCPPRPVAQLSVRPVAPAAGGSPRCYASCRCPFGRALCRPGAKKPARRLHPAGGGDYAQGRNPLRERPYRQVPGAGPRRGRPQLV